MSIIIKEVVGKKDLKKWGQFIDEDKFYIKQCNLSRYSPKTFLNVLFKYIKKIDIGRVFNKMISSIEIINNNFR